MMQFFLYSLEINTGGFLTEALRNILGLCIALYQDLFDDCYDGLYFFPAD